mgnify:CR=1 FL=1
MAIRSLKTNSFSRSLLNGNSAFIPGSYESIATVSVGSSGTATISFTSIPQTYTHLQLRYIARNAYTGGGSYTNSDMYINGDTTASHYTFHRLSGDGATASASAAANAGSIYVLATNANASANIFGVGVMDILDYTNTNKYKTIKILDGYDNNGSGFVDGPRSGSWLSTSAVTSFSITNPASTNWVQYSRFALYGIKVS